MKLTDGEKKILQYAKPVSREGLQYTGIDHYDLVKNLDKHSMLEGVKGLYEKGVLIKGRGTIKNDCGHHINVICESIVNREDVLMNIQEEDNEM